MGTRTRKDELREEAVAFHKTHPRVWVLFCRFTYELIERGFKHYSAKGIFERIRWETDQAGYDGESTFKLNNNYSAFYARAFMKMYPQHDGFFRVRQQVSDKRGPVALPPLGPQDFDYSNETRSYN